MNRRIFLLNDRFRIYPALNQVQDIQSGRTTRLEPRIMAVLEMLMNRAGQLVSREEMIRDIWHNYGGGDEALSQAVSFLRKTLLDGEKKTIQTIPKKGYRLTGLLSADEMPQTKSVIKLFYLRQLSRFAVLLYVIGTAAYFLYAGLYRQPQAAQQQVALIKYSAPQLPVVSAPGKVQKIAHLTTNRSYTAVTILSKNSNAESTQRLPEHEANQPIVLPAQTITKFYHLRDTTAQMITALDYKVTTKVQINTALN